jgi:membrane associated rhomboid family serine protease
MNILRKPFKYRYGRGVYFLIGINALIFAAPYITGSRYINIYLSMIPAAVMEGWVWQFVTYMFVHGSLTHILFNMLALFLFGGQVERRIGTPEFILFYLTTGILAGVFSFVVYLLTGAYGVVLMGASGAIFAVQLAYAVLFPNSVILVFGLFPLRAPVAVLLFTGIELFLSVTGIQSGVAHLTHLAGFAVAWLYFLVRFGVNPWRYLLPRR